MGIDIGTTGTKVISFSPEGNIIASAYREYPLSQPKPGWNELDADEVWGHIRDAVREVGSCTDGIKALSISSQGEAFVPVDTEGNPLGPVIVTFDNRATDEAADLAGKFSPSAIMEITGMPVSHICTLPKIMWWKNAAPEVFDKAAYFLCMEDFAFMRMGLDPTIDTSLGARTMALDLSTGVWSQPLLEAAGIDSNRLARPAPSGTVVGELSAEAAKELNLPPGVPAVTGGHDQTAGAFGCGIAEPGEAMYAIGTVECLAAVFDSIVANDTMLENNLCCYPHVAAGTWASIAFNFTGGSLLRWYRDQFNTLEKFNALMTAGDVYDQMLKGLPEDPSGILVLPHFTSTGTPHMDPEPVGAIVGLSLATTKNQVTKAVLEGPTYEMKLNLELLKSAGVKVNRLRAVGGGAKSDAWLQIKADIMGLPILRMEVTEAACLGVAMKAGVAVGVYSSDAQAVEATCRPGDEFHPDPKRQARYAQLFGGYEKLYDSLKPINKAIREQ